jgi:hypothetical protein
VESVKSDDQAPEVDAICKLSSILWGKKEIAKRRSSSKMDVRPAQVKTQGKKVSDAFKIQSAKLKKTR